MPRSPRPLPPPLRGSTRSHPLSPVATPPVFTGPPWTAVSPRRGPLALIASQWGGGGGSLAGARRAGRGGYVCPRRRWPSRCWPSRRGRGMWRLREEGWIALGGGGGERRRWGGGSPPATAATPPLSQHPITASPPTDDAAAAFAAAAAAATAAAAAAATAAACALGSPLAATAAAYHRVCRRDLHRCRRRRRRRRRRLRHRFLSRPPSQRTRAIHEGCCGRLREDANCGDASRAPPPFGVGARRAKRGGGEAYRGRVGCVARRAARPWQAASPIPLHSVSGGMSTASR